MTSSISSNQAWHVQCVTQASADTNPSLMVVFDDARYLFDCGENTTRALVQDRISVKKLKSVWLSSSVQIESTSGLGGLLLSMGEKDGSEIDVYGPEGVNHVLASMRYHTRRPKMRVNTHELMPRMAGLELGDEPVYQDSNVKIHAFPLLPATSNATGPLPSSAMPTKRRSRSRSASPPAKRHANGRPVNGASVEMGAVSEAGPAASDLDWYGRGLRPADLEGEEAYRWRRMVVDDMFRAGRPPRPHTVPGSPRNNGAGQQHSSPAYNPSRLPPYQPSPVAVCYLVTGPAVRGRFILHAAKAQGVPPGPDFGKLTRGEEVTLPDGRVIKPESCCEPGLPPSSIAFVTCPNESYIDSLLSTRIGAIATKQGSRLRQVFHFLGPGVLDNRAYREWASLFGPSVAHVVSSPDLQHNGISFASAAILQARLSRLSPANFPTAKYDLKPYKLEANHFGVDLPDTQYSRLEMGKVYPLNGLPSIGETARLRTFKYEPGSAEAEEAESKLNDKNEQTRAHSKEAWQEYQVLIKEAQENIEQEEGSSAVTGFPGSDIVVTALGTGSASPSKYRNVSSTLLQLPNGKAILLDAGEGTHGQLARLFGDKCKELLTSLSCIFISHMHADHHCGLAMLLHQRAKVKPGTTLFVVCPPQVQTYLRDLDTLQCLGLDAGVFFIDANHLLPDRRPPSSISKLLEVLSLQKIETVLVNHRARCFGVVLEGSDESKIVYSGDTQPCDALVEAGKNATLLIHEATIEDDMPEVARVKGIFNLSSHECGHLRAYAGHSTFAEALDIAKRMEAKHCLLTHFSQRYPKFPPLSERDSDPAACKVAVAFDLMSIRIGDIWKARHWTKPLQMLFSEWEGDDSTEAGAEPVEEGKGKNKTESKGKEKEKEKTKKNQQKQKDKQKAKKVPPAAL